MQTNLSKINNVNKKKCVHNESKEKENPIAITQNQVLKELQASISSYNNTFNIANNNNNNNNNYNTNYHDKKQVNLTSNNDFTKQKLLTNESIDNTNNNNFSSNNADLTTNWTKMISFANWTSNTIDNNNNNNINNNNAIVRKNSNEKIKNIVKKENIQDYEKIKIKYSGDEFKNNINNKVLTWNEKSVLKTNFIDDSRLDSSITFFENISKQSPVKDNNNNKNNNNNNNLMKTKYEPIRNPTRNSNLNANLLGNSVMENNTNKNVDMLKNSTLKSENSEGVLRLLEAVRTLGFYFYLFIYFKFLLI
jgi:hypothetical protein